MYITDFTIVMTVKEVKTALYMKLIRNLIHCGFLEVYNQHSFILSWILGNEKVNKNKIIT